MQVLSTKKSPATLAGRILARLAMLPPLSPSEAPALNQTSQTDLAFASPTPHGLRCPHGLAAALPARFGLGTLLCQGCLSLPTRHHVRRRRFLLRHRCPTQLRQGCRDEPSRSRTPLAPFQSASIESSKIR